MSEQQLLAVLCECIMSKFRPQRRVDIPSLLNAIAVPEAYDDPDLSKAKYIQSRLELIESCAAPEITEVFLHKHAEALPPANRFELEEVFWIVSKKSVIVPKRARYEIARSLQNNTLYNEPGPFMELSLRYWSREDNFYGNLFTALTGKSILDAIFEPTFTSIFERCLHLLIQNPSKWTTEYFFDAVGAFSCSDQRFVLFVEGLASSELRPDENNQRAFVSAVNGALDGSNLELREVDCDGGFPVFRFSYIGVAAGSPKNLIFASSKKPDLRFTDAIDNNIEILDSNINMPGGVLVYDRPFPPDGLCWKDLQAWWAETKKIDEDTAKKTLYRHLLASLPQNSPPQKLLFETFYKCFAEKIPQLPALLPEVWLHWDYKTVRERGTEALIRFRMDFLMLFPHDIRVVIEVDGRHHYASDDGAASPDRYAKMVRADRELRMAGYDVYRFGATELNTENDKGSVKSFFECLFKRYRVSL